MRRMTENRPEIVLAILVGLSLVSLITGARAGFIGGFLRQAVSITAYPFVKTMDWTGRTTSYVLDGILAYDTLRDDYTRQREQIARMNKWHRMIMGGARYTPKLLPFMIKAGFHLARKGGRRAFLHAVLGEAEADVALLSEPDFLEAMVTGSHVALNDTHTAHDAMSRNVLEQARVDWTRAVRATQTHAIPVHMVNGAQDVQSPPETLAEFRQDYPWINFHIHEDAGQLVLFAKWPEVLALLRPFLQPC